MGDTKLSYAQSQGTNKHQHNGLGSELSDTGINSVSIYSGITRKTEKALSSQIYPQTAGRILVAENMSQGGPIHPYPVPLLPVLPGCGVIG